MTNGIGCFYLNWQTNIFGKRWKKAHFYNPIGINHFRSNRLTKNICRDNETDAGNITDIIKSK